MSDEYLFDTASELGRKQMDYLESILDGVTTDCLESTGVGAGHRCLDLGAGGGSITRWLGERTGSRGTVVSVDLDTEYLEERPGVEVYRHDINDGLPVDGTFDFIHARLLLMHLPRREQIFKTLIDALAPGGWLVIGECTAERPLRVISSPSQADEELFHRVQDISHNVVARGRGVSLGWAYEVDHRMAEAGLTGLHTVEFTKAASGGEDGCLLHRNYNLQAEQPLLDAGLTEKELKRYRELMLDPAFRTWFYPFVCTRGRKPA